MKGIHDTETEILIHILAGKKEENIAENRDMEKQDEEGLDAEKPDTVSPYAEGIDSDKLAGLAMIHRATYPVLQYARQHEGLFSGRQMHELEEHARQNAIRSLMQLHELIRIAGMFSSKGISWACIKGPQLSRMLYGREALKESVDLDLMLLDSHELGIVHQGLKEMGYGQSNLDHYRTKPARKLFLLAKREVHYINPEKSMHLDLHVRAAANAYLTISGHSGLFRELTTFDIEGAPVPILPAEKYFNFLCHHGAMHQFSSLGWLMDVRQFMRQIKEGMDFEKVRQISFELKTERSLWLSLLLLNELFDDEFPVPVPQNGRLGRKIRYLARACSNRWLMNVEDSLSLQGRISRLLYLMVLSKGLAAKADIVIGILIRSLLPALRWLRL